VSVGVCGAPSTAIVKVPVGVAVAELDPDATVIVIASFVPTVGVVVAVESVVFDATGAAVTVTVTDPLDAA
jgi:hypothetical protein